MKLVQPSSNLVPLVPRNQLAPDSGYDSLLADWLARTRSPHTKRMYQGNIRQFFQSLGVSPLPEHLASFLLLESHQAHELVSQYHGLLVSASLAPATINQKLAALKSLVTYANQIGKCHYIGLWTKKIVVSVIFTLINRRNLSPLSPTH